MSCLTASIAAMPLDLEVDDVITRRQLNAVYGGGIQGGMLTPARHPYIFLFSDPVPGDQYGYTWDGWADERLETFFYTGEGSLGDQEFTRRNRILCDASAQGREVHLFVADGYTKGSRERTHRYMGQFAVDPRDPWRREDSPDERGTMRSAIVFRLSRLSTSASPHTHTEAQSPKLALQNGAEVIDSEASRSIRFNRAAQKESVSTRRERLLEDMFHRYLYDAGGRPSRIRIRIAGQASPLYTDTWDSVARELYEAKGSVSRNDIRLAVGQLLDYRRHINPPPARCTVLLPSNPGADLTDLIHSSGLDLVYQEGNSFVRRTAPVGEVLDDTSHNGKSKTVSLAAASFPSQPPNPVETEGRMIPEKSSSTPRRLDVGNSAQTVVGRD